MPRNLTVVEDAAGRAVQVDLSMLLDVRIDGPTLTLVLFDGSAVALSGDEAARVANLLEDQGKETYP